MCLLEPDLFRSLLLNLVDNSRKALEKGGRIALTCTMTGTGCRLTVEDNGRGMPPEVLAHLTEAFYRVDKSRARAQGGAGLGLACVSGSPCSTAAPFTLPAPPARVPPSPFPWKEAAHEARPFPCAAPAGLRPWWAWGSSCRGWEPLGRTPPWSKPQPNTRLPLCWTTTCPAT